MQFRFLRFPLLATPWHILHYWFGDILNLTLEASFRGTGFLAKFLPFLCKVFYYFCFLEVLIKELSYSLSISFEYISLLKDILTTGKCQGSEKISNIGNVFGHRSYVSYLSYFSSSLIKWKELLGKFALNIFLVKWTLQLNYDLHEKAID